MTELRKPLKRVVPLTVRISSYKRDKLQAIAHTEGRTIREVLERLIDQCRGVKREETRELRRATVLIPPNIVRQIRADHEGGMPFRALADKYGYGLRTVWRACKKQGAYRKVKTRGGTGRKRMLAPDDDRAIIELYLCNVPIETIAAQYNTSPRTVYRAITRAKALKGTA